RSGLRGTVMFPDGSHRLAEVTETPEVARELPRAHLQAFGSGEVGVLVRMRFLDEQAALAGASNGLPIKVRFDNDWQLPLPQQWLAGVDALRQRIKDADWPRRPHGNANDEHPPG
ncbi:MAG TPA: hypothetical protein VLI06_06895, partial [Solimonas sp.]|nr:hypothetical protein [Solimonas sp.]